MRQNAIVSLAINYKKNLLEFTTTTENTLTYFKPFPITANLHEYVKRVVMSTLHGVNIIFFLLTTNNIHRTKRDIRSFTASQHRNGLNNET